MSDRQMIKRDVRSEDPTLSAGSNRLLTDEMRAIVGTDTVEVAADRPDHSHDEHATHSSSRASLENVRLLLAIAALVAAVSAAAIGLGAEGSAVLLVAAVLLLLIGSGVVVKTVLGMTAEGEHLSPTSAARLEAEGVDRPDAVLGELVADTAPRDD